VRRWRRGESTRKGSDLASDNHPGDALGAERLAAGGVVAAHAGDDEAEACDEQEHGRYDQRRRSKDQAGPLSSAHGEVDDCPHHIRAEAPHKGVKFFRRWADAHEQRNLHKDEKGARDCAHDSPDNVLAEDVGDADGKAENDAEHSSPLTVDTKVARLELVHETHGDDSDGFECQSNQSIDVL